MSKKKRWQSLIEMAMEVGARAVSEVTVTGGTHIVLSVTAPNGVARKFFMAMTPSCRRADLNNRSLIRRFCRSNGSVVS